VGWFVLGVGVGGCFFFFCGCLGFFWVLGGVWGFRVARATLPTNKRAKGRGGRQDHSASGPTEKQKNNRDVAKGNGWGGKSRVK